MPTHESLDSDSLTQAGAVHTSALRNDKAHKGLAGNLGTKDVRPAAIANASPYALGDAVGDLLPARPAAAVTSPAALQIQVVITADPDCSSYKVYRGATLIGTEASAGTKTYTGQTAGTHSVTVKGLDEYGTPFTVSTADTVIVAAV